MRVLHGITGAAGQPAIVSKAQRKHGIEAASVMAYYSKFGYKSDYFYEIIGDGFEQYSHMLKEMSPKYDIFHFYFRPYFYFNPKYLSFPTAYDLLLLRLLGKTIIFNYRGSEVRSGKSFKRLSPFNYVEENPGKLFTKFPDEQIDRLRSVVDTLSHRVLVPDPELQSYVPNSVIVPRAIDLTEWPFVGAVNSQDPIVIHAPSRRVVKGSDYVIQAVNELKAEGLRFRFELIENLSNDEAREKYKKSDIVVDQLRIGWYGVFAVEAMALGKAVVSYIRDDLYHHLGDIPPLCNANPTNIKEKLRHLIKDHGKRKRMGERARAYCEDLHDSEKVARQLIAIYEEAETVERFVENIEPLIDYIGYHKRFHDKSIHNVHRLAQRIKARTPSRSKWETFKVVARQQGLSFAFQKAFQKVFLLRPR